MRFLSTEVVNRKNAQVYELAMAINFPPRQPVPTWPDLIETSRKLEPRKNLVQGSVTFVWLDGLGMTTKMWTSAHFDSLWTFGVVGNLLVFLFWVCHATLRSDDPPFLQTCATEIPWEDEAIFTQVLMCEDDKPSFHKIDLFHTVTLGVGKSYAASCFTILQELMQGTSVEERLKELTSLYLEFCRDP